MIEKNDFLLKKLSPKACIHPRAYTVIFRFVPCDRSFDLGNNKHLCNIEEENDLQVSSIAAASWCKCPDRRSPGQTTATLKVACANPDTANCLLTGRIWVNEDLVTVHKDLHIPIRCVKCQEYGHVQDTCIGVEKCTNCGSEFHHTDKCDRAPNCVSCSKGSNHPSTSPLCPTFLRKCKALDGQYPENTMPYFLSKEGWAWEASPTNPLPPAARNSRPTIPASKLQPMLHTPTTSNATSQRSQIRGRSPTTTGSIASGGWRLGNSLPLAKVAPMTSAIHHHRHVGPTVKLR